MSSTSDKAKLFAENFSKNSNLDDLGISLPVFLSRTNLKLHNISVTPKMVKKVIMNLDLSKASGPDCIPVVILKNCEPELSYILAKLFHKCLKESCFPDCWNVLSVVPVFQNVGERSTAKNYCPVSLLSVVSKVFEKLVNNRIVDDLEKCGLFPDFQYFFNCYLAAPRPTSGHYRGDSLTHPMLITAFYILNPRVTRSLVVRLDP